MTNIEAVERFEQSHSTKIETMFWIAGSIGNSEFKDFLEEMDDDSFKVCFPEIFNSDYYNDYKDNNELGQALVDYGKFGLLAEIHIPKCDNFKYQERKLIGWSVHEGNCRVEYVYAETLELLMGEIEKTSESVFQEYLKKDKKKATA